MPLPIEKFIGELSSGNALPSNSSLATLSKLNAPGLALFQKAWGTVATGSRQQIIERLVELAEDNVELNFDAIFKYCLKDQDEEVRSKAIEGLWENEEASLINPLIGLLEQDSSARVQATAAIALGKFALMAEHGKLRSEYTAKIEEALLAALDDKNKQVDVRRRSLEAVSPLSTARVDAAIGAAYKNNELPLRISAIYAMGRHCDRTWLPMLLHELENDEAEVRHEFAGALDERDEEEPVSGLIRLIGDPDADVQMMAIQALGKIGGAEARRRLERCLKSGNQAIRHAAEEAITEMEATKSLSSYAYEVRSSNN